MTSSLHIDTPAACAQHDTMFVGFELGKAKWKVGIVLPGSSKLSQYTVAGGDAEAALRLISKARQKAEKQAGGRVRVVSCYEAGYDGFWLHRWLEERGIENRVLDAASVQVNRRARRAKTDRLDLERLMSALMRHDWGDRLACRVVHVPSVAQEDDRRTGRERARLVKERRIWWPNSSENMAGCCWSKSRLPRSRRRPWPPAKRPCPTPWPARSTS